MIGLTTLAIVFSVQAQAAGLVAGQYASTGSVASNNGASTCSQVGLTPGTANDSIVTYPGPSKAGFMLYVPAPGLLQLCSKFPATPANGLTDFVASASCAVFTLSGNFPASTVNFEFKTTVTNAASGIGTTSVSIPSTSPLGAGCNATINTTIVRVGK